MVVGVEGNAKYISLNTEVPWKNSFNEEMATMQTQMQSAVSISVLLMTWTIQSWLKRTFNNVYV